MSQCGFNAGREKTNHWRRSRTTSIIVGRRAESWYQQRTAMSRTESVSPSSCAFSGRVGSLLSAISGTTTGVVNSLDASLPEETLGRVQALSEPMERHTRTDLHRYHAESRDVCLPCGCTQSREIIWRGRRYIAPISLRYGVDFAKNGGKLNSRQTSMAVAIDEDIGLPESHR